MSTPANHVFICATCGTQWIIHSNDQKGCSVGLCNLCIIKIGLTVEEITVKIKILAVEERFANELAETRGL